MEYFVYYDDGGKKTIKSFNGDVSEACAFCRSMLDEDPYERVVRGQDFIPTVWYRPELYSGPVLVTCKAHNDKESPYYQAANEFMDLVNAQEISRYKLSPWYTKEDEWPMN